jgi:hypothetical protein
MDGEVHRLEQAEAQEMDGAHYEQLDGEFLQERRSKYSSITGSLCVSTHGW